jgi:hypothetical protein
MSWKKIGPSPESRGGPTTIWTRTTPTWFPLTPAFGSRSLVEQLVDIPSVRRAAFFLADQGGEMATSRRSSESMVAMSRMREHMVARQS